mgnify:CR=1 FL=1
MEENQCLAKIQVETSDPRLHAYMAGEGKGTADVGLFFCAPPTLAVPAFHCKRLFFCAGIVVFHTILTPFFNELAVLGQKGLI